jgi:heptaprenyl diphosphate synthase
MILYQSRHHKQLQHVVEEVKNSFFNTYAKQYATYPDMDLFQLHFTYLFMNHKNVSEHLREVHCVCQAFIQMALDSHDEVGTEDVHDDLSFKNRQLTILSGDYFSSYYYFYLANKEQPELIPTYSEAIK